MTRYFVSVLCVLMTIGATQLGHTRDADGIFVARGRMVSCGEYLEAYSRTTLDDDASAFTGPREFSSAIGWINGYISGYNASTENGKEDIAAGLSGFDVYRWIASWCRDNPSKGLVRAIGDFINSRD